jgi:hypothetical protein
VAAAVTSLAYGAFNGLYADVSTEKPTSKGFLGVANYEWKMEFTSD